MLQQATRDLQIAENKDDTPELALWELEPKNPLLRFISTCEVLNQTRTSTRKPTITLKASSRCMVIPMNKSCPILRRLTEGKPKRGYDISYYYYEQTRYTH